MNFKKTVLASGLRVITVPMADNPSVTIFVMAEAGSEYETRERSGISHFLEHILFKGTPKRPRPSDISRELDSIGAHYNAFTTQEFTGYYAKADSRNFDMILDILSDMYQHPLLDDKEMNKEKGVIIEELRMYRDLPQQHVQEVMAALLHGDQPAGWSVIGTEETIASFDRSRVSAYMSERYVARATTVVVAGAFDEASVISKVEKSFASLSTAPKLPKPEVTGSESSPAIRIEAKQTDQSHLIIAVRTFPIGDPRIPAMRVLSTIMGSGMSSRLFSRMRDELGICYYIHAGHEAAVDHGDFFIAAGVDNSRVEEAVREILKECSRLTTAEVPADELKKAKDHIAGTTALGLETSEARAEFCASQELLKGKIEAPEALLAKTNAVTAADIQKLAREIFVDAGLNLALVGRSDEASLKPLLKF